MTLPDPEPGLVISYAYLWHHEHAKGREEGLKHRPCVVVLSVSRVSEGPPTVLVAPITHVRPADPETGIAIPPRVKHHLGLDSEPSWVIVDELNEFAWPGFDLRPVPGDARRVAFGFLPPRLFADVVSGIAAVWRRGRGHRISR
jgi:hypothetical protein